VLAIVVEKDLSRSFCRLKGATVVHRKLARLDKV
jgi:hypothetical protein